MEHSNGGDTTGIEQREKVGKVTDTEMMRREVIEWR